MKTNWQTKKLGDICDFINGRSFKKTEWLQEGNGSLPIIRIENLNNPNSTFNYFKGEFDDKILIKNGDLLFSWSGSIGTSFGPHIWKGGDGLLNQHIYKVIFNNNDIDKQYLYLALKALVVIVEKNLHGGVGLVHITKAKLNNLEIPFPPLTTQHQIVAILDEKFAKLREAKRLRQEAIGDTEKILRATLREIFDEGKEKFEMTNLGDVAKLIRGPFGGSLKKEIFVPEGIAVYEQGNVIDNTLDDFRYFVTDEKFKEMKRFEVSAGDILMSCSGTIGKFVIIPDKFTKGIINQALLKITPQKTITVDYLKYALQDYLAESTTHIKGGAIKNIASVKELKQFSIPLPPLAEQQKIVTHLDALSEKLRTLRELQQSQLEDMKKLEKAYLREAFRNELI